MSLTWYISQFPVLSSLIFPSGVWKSVYKKQYPPRNQRNVIQFVISLSHLIFYLFQMMAKNFLFLSISNIFLFLFQKKLTFYWVYLIIKSFSLEENDVKRRDENEHSEEDWGGGGGGKQAHNSIKYLFDSNVFIDEKLRGMFFHIFLLVFCKRLVRQ